MILDTTLVFSDQQAVTGSAPSVNVIDLGSTGTSYGGSAPLTRDLGKGQPIEIAVSVGQSFAGLASLQVAVQTSPDNLNWTTRDSGRVVSVSELVAGYAFHVPNVIQSAPDRFVRLFYTVTGTATQGTINAAIAASRQTNTTYGGR